MLKATEIRKEYPTAAGPLVVLESVSLELARGEALSIMGPSGSGKSTLLYILGTLDRPSSGQVSIEGQDPFALDEKQQAHFRNKHIGFLFQDHCLLPQCTVLENVLTPVLVDGKPDEATRKRAEKLLGQVGLSNRAHHRPAELSGGEKQRTAIARAMIREPLLLLCDEPTGNLDRRSADAVAELLLELHKAQRTILMVVTHSQDLADRFPRRFEMQDRQLKAR